MTLRGMVNGMDQSFKSFGIGFGLSFVLLFLILVAQFRSWVDTFPIMLAIPMGFIGVLIILPLTRTTLNVMPGGGSCRNRGQAWQNRMASELAPAKANSAPCSARLPWIRLRSPQRGPGRMPGPSATGFDYLLGGH